MKLEWSDNYYDDEMNTIWVAKSQAVGGGHEFCISQVLADDCIKFNVEESDEELIPVSMQGGYPFIDELEEAQAYCQEVEDAIEERAKAALEGK